jgi:hypothetical protein
MSSHSINILKNAIALIAAYALYSSASAGNVKIFVLDKEGKPVTDAVVVIYPSFTPPSPALVARAATVV